MFLGGERFVLFGFDSLFFFLGFDIILNTIYICRKFVLIYKILFASLRKERTVAPYRHHSSSEKKFKILIVVFRHFLRVFY